ncbi:helix-turn-helix domain-containing protein [Chryseobacterium foetidum]|uniref:helix-turn-helix domain-containing protein n=1 Tax=Chryseobacterium foetidum TaxID=2951057 RepID=UPI0021CADC54|nr:helix-turn-helix domain-containing protein [Chryseobacterium foetidum]
MEVAAYLGYKPKYIYQLIHKKKIPFSKPFGRKLVFSRQKIDDFIALNTAKTEQELQIETAHYFLNNN